VHLSPLSAVTKPASTFADAPTTEQACGVRDLTSTFETLEVGTFICARCGEISRASNFNSKFDIFAASPGTNVFSSTHLINWDAFVIDNGVTVELATPDNVDNVALVLKVKFFVSPTPSALIAKIEIS
jgi:hypothetical protein